MQKILATLLILLGIYFSSASSAFAADEDIPYGIRMPYRIIRGVTNIALGWTEILLRPIGERKTESFGEAVSMGGANTLARLAGGATDITTFWVPDIRMQEIYPDWQGWPYLFHWS